MQRGSRCNEDKIEFSQPYSVFNFPQFFNQMKNNQESFLSSVKCRIRTVYYGLVYHNDDYDEEEGNFCDDYENDWAMSSVKWEKKYCELSAEEANLVKPAKHLFLNTELLLPGHWPVTK